MLWFFYTYTRWCRIIEPKSWWYVLFNCSHRHNCNYIEYSAYNNWCSWRIWACSWKTLQRRGVTLILWFSKEVLLCSFYASQNKTKSDAVSLISLFYASVGKKFHITLILPHWSTFSTKSLQYLILSSIIICYSKFMMSMEA